MTIAFIIACIVIAASLVVITAMTVTLREAEETIDELDADRSKLATDLALAKRNSLPYEAELLRDTTDPLFGDPR